MDLRSVKLKDLEEVKKLDSDNIIFSKISDDIEELKDSVIYLENRLDLTFTDQKLKSIDEQLYTLQEKINNIENSLDTDNNYYTNLVWWLGFFFAYIYIFIK